MKFSTTYLALLLVSLLLAYACDDEDDDDFTINGTNIAMADIAGSWNATKGLFGSTALGPVVETDVVADGGTLTLNIQSTGRFTLTITVAGQAPEVTTGRMAFDVDLLVIFFDDDPEEWEYFSITHNEPNLFISGGNGSAEFDFDGDGTDEPANVDFVFTRI